ncbi:MAG: hypothetical protein E3J71_07790 [Candidatus Stahlbacteria bacterium]|nr:MAG: hypothetical protein E3J71_07790 [Candidatus Stahlbacteria bacterium]
MAKKGERTWEDEKKFQAQLEEYKQLRAEILTRSRGVYYMILALFYPAALGFGIARSDHLITLMTAFLPLIIWIMDIQNDYSIHRLGAYIELQLERKLVGLNWEHYKEEERPLRPRLDRCFAILSQMLLPLLVVLSSGMSLLLWFSNKGPYYFLFMWGGISVLLLILSIVAFVYRSNIKKYRERLRRILGGAER